jgi:multidrug efflux pump subunit AcrB
VPRLAFAGGLAALALVGAFALGRYTASPAPAEKHTVIARQQPTPPTTGTQTTQNPDTKSAIPELPRPTIAPDPTTQMAETLVRQQEQAETRQEAERKRNEERLAKLVSQSQTGKEGQPVEIALTVRNTSWTRDRLREWAERAGGKLDEMPAARAISDKAIPPATGTKKSIDPNLVALRVPVDRATALLKVMQGMEDTRQQASSGKVSRVPMKFARATVSADSRLQNGSIPLAGHARKEIDEIKTENLDSPRSSEHVFTETPGKPYVTLFVRFRPAPIK